MMKFLVTLLVAACLLTIGEGRLQSQRALYGGSYDYVDLYERCCGDDTSQCKCPVRDSDWTWISNWWAKKCDQFASKIAEDADP